MANKKLQKAFEHDTFVLPSDILFFIIVRLPVQSLLRFKSICRSWKVTISDKEFIKVHRDQQIASGRKELLMRSESTHTLVFPDLENRLVLVTRDVIPSS
ncbi:hypothetical protein BC332_34055 [Capsicum chinense]|nr:hypothetical protein BC332_34055 [Capsicum chinense]